jgi:hypothetical protein
MTDGVAETEFRGGISVAGIDLLVYRIKNG